MTIQTRPNRYRHGVLMVLEFAALDAEPLKARVITKAQLSALAAIERCLNCPLESCNEKLCKQLKLRR